jgi:biopolymer transport protein ExbD
MRAELAGHLVVDYYQRKAQEVSMPVKKETQSASIRREALDERPDIMMTPMVDCVFQLLIFFMLACRFRTSEGKLEAFLPKTGPGIPPTPPIIIERVRVKLLWVEPNSLRETRDPNNGRALLKVKDRNFKWVTNKFGETLPDYDELYKIIVKARDVFKPTKSYKTLPVIIDARPQVPFKHVVHVLNNCIKAKLTDITFAAPEIPY